MATTTAIPIDIMAEAMARVMRLNMQREFEEMLEHTRDAVGNLRSIDVKLNEVFDEPGEPHISILAWKHGSWPADGDPTTEEWLGWVVRQFPADVVRWFDFDMLYWDENGPRNHP